MKGVLFNVVEDVVTEVMSADAWDRLVDESGVGGAYTSLGNYDDAELVALVVRIAEAAGLSLDDTLRLAGERGFAHLARRNPTVLADFDSWRDVLAGLDDIIHPEVRKMYPGADVPAFGVVERDDAGMLLEYESRRAFCRLAEGLILGCGAWFDATVTVTHTSCRAAGDDRCLLRVDETS